MSKKISKGRSHDEGGGENGKRAENQETELGKDQEEQQGKGREGGEGEKEAKERQASEDDWRFSWRRATSKHQVGCRRRELKQKQQELEANRSKRETSKRIRNKRRTRNNDEET